MIRMFRLMTEEQKKETIQDAQETVTANERMLEQLLAIKRA
jgi:hypothetical protein